MSELEEMNAATVKPDVEWMHKGLNWETDEQIREKGIQALTRELGPVGMVRFITLYRPGSGDYTAERRARLDAMTPEEEEEEERLEMLEEREGRLEEALKNE